MSLIPPQYLNAVISIEVENLDHNKVSQKRSIATGFLIGKQTGEKNEKGPLYQLLGESDYHKQCLL